jgi:hypothetical protein
VASQSICSCTTIEVIGALKRLSTRGVQCAIKVSLPLVPIKAFTLAVSGQVARRDKYLIFKDFL